ncbi:PTS sugar transporter subunit IIA [Enterococcus faecium]|uniref:PTS mannose transporter subunit IIA n=2 Tax=Enterococcus TaxID=1350 RepID=A0A6A8NKW1_ENTFC|nr:MULTISPECIES: PTS sugar transporter subunit IIA [Enterococcus]EJC3740874.1 PTS sugar transporter subunit IIA [Enterococcus faecium]MBD9709706.1 PTS sugar transporter subunit IIA [Enterococcus faecium]MBO6419894.1 PTS sugar transporter subunit IIA [Enterococcus gallinarum]MBO6423464.1 PTS sugar transporter subunit IIA [Enterococcus gallinarum]MBT1020481.1 PTS sugar transporter subunit IIA [Enterococcus faecium]
MTNEIILMSHGLMAEEILNSAKMILGNQINYPVVSMTQNDGIEGTINKLNKILEETSDIRNIIILVDLMGGTPANVAMMKASMDKRIQVVTGMNLGMVLESYFKINEEKLAEHLIEIGKSSIKIPEIQMDGGEE